MTTWQNQEIERYSISFALSIAFNFIVLLLCGLLMNSKQNAGASNNPIGKKDYIVVESFKRTPPKGMRTAGVKGGKKDSFSSPMKMDKGNGGFDKSTTKGKAGQNGQSDSPISMKQLAAAPAVGSNFKPQKQTKPQAIQKESTSQSSEDFFYKPKEPVEQRLKKQQQQLQGDVMKQLAASPSAGAALSGKGFNIQFDPPEGIPEDELNSVEKIFYSFQKRTFETYVNSFIKTYYDVLRESPILKAQLNNERHRLNGRVTFDEKGNITAVKILRSTQSDEVHKLFEKTLDRMRAIPNPPKDLVQKDGTFTIYYSLYIN